MKETAYPAGHVEEHQQVGDLTRSRYTTLALGSVDSDGEWVNETNGDMLSSLLSGPNRQHAPMFHIRSVVTLDDNSVLTFIAPEKKELAKSVKQLAKLGIIHKDTRDSVLTRIKNGDITPGDNIGVALAIPAHLSTSRQRGHCYLYLDTPMTFKNTVKAANAMFGLVDPAHTFVSEKAEQWIVRIPEPPEISSPTYMSTEPEKSGIFATLRHRAAS